MIFCTEAILHIIHNIEPIFDSDCKILILGSLPSPKSREVGIFYGHPQNRFWRVLSAVFNEPLPLSNDDKKQFLLKHHIAVWDVVKECDIIGASDSSIKNVVVNDFSCIFNVANIKAVFTTGKTANKLFKKYTGKDAVYLPSTSPTNCAVSFEDLVKQYSVLKDYLYK